MCDTDRNQKRLLELLNKAGNNKCADCGGEGVEYGSFNLGAFLCTPCASVHLRIGIHISKVKSLRLAKWNDDHIEAMESRGNLEVNKKFEKHLPIYYRKPIPDAPSILLEQFIRAKYERLEFMHVDKQEYNKGNMDDTLLVKKKGSDSHYLPKRFLLSEDQCTLAIFLKENDAKEPKIIPLVKLNICLSPAKMNMENSMQLTYIDEGLTKHIFVSHSKAEVIINWYMGIRHVKLISLMRAYPTIPYGDLEAHLTNDFQMEGWISKTGPQEKDAYRKRWVTLDKRKLMYHYGPVDEDPRGEIFLGQKDEKFDVIEGANIGCKEMGFVFSLVTPDRTYNFSVATAAERLNWMNAIGKVIDSPLGFLDIQTRTSLDANKRRNGRHSWFMEFFFN